MKKKKEFHTYEQEKKNFLPALVDKNLHLKICFFIAAASAGVVIIRTFWLAAIMREPSFCGMDSPASGPKSTRCDD